MTRALCATGMVTQRGAKKGGMIIRSKAPLRISFSGGGTDLPHWYEEHGGAVFSSTINRYAYATLYPRANSWYMGSNVPGKPRVFLPYIGGFGVYSDKCNEVAEKGYAGFALSARTN